MSNHRRFNATAVLVAVVAAATLVAAALLAPPAAASEYPSAPGDLLWMQTWHPRSDFMKYGLIDVVRGPGGDLWLGIGGSTSSGDSPYEKRICVARYSANGVKRWTRVLPSPVSMTFYYGIAVDRRGSAIVVGQRLDYDVTTGYPWVITKLSPSGKRLWTKVRPSPAYSDHAKPSGVAVDSRGDIYVSGTMTRTTTGDDVVLTKYASTGALKWTRYIDGYEGSNDTGVDVAVDPKDRVFVLGTMGSFFAGSDITFAQYTTGGKQVGKRTWDGSSHDDVATDLAVTPYNVVIAGSADGADGRARGVILLCAANINDYLIPETITSVPGSDLTWTSVAKGTDGPIAAGGTVTGVGPSEFAYATWPGSMEASATFYPSPAGSATCDDIAMMADGTAVGVGTFYDAGYAGDLHVMSDPQTGSGWRTTVGLPSREDGRSLVVTNSGVYVTGECGQQIGLWKFQP